MVDFKNIKKVEGIYSSILYKDYYSLDVLVERGNFLLRVRYPYNTKEKAREALRAARMKQQIPEPCYRPSVFIIGNIKEEVR